jgi:S1-C subfamily serine protease
MYVDVTLYTTIRGNTMRLLLGCLLLLAIASLAATAQVTVTKTDSGKTMVMIQGSGTFLPEIGAAVGFEDNELRILHAMPPDARPKGATQVDLRTGDRILMVNAKPAKSAEVFKKFYESAAPGDTIKLGIKRGESLHIVAFVKADPKDLPKGRKMIIRKND